MPNGWLNVPHFRQEFIVDLRINETLQIGAVENSAYRTWGAKVSVYFSSLL